MELEQIKELISRLEEGKVKKFLLKKGDFELQLEKEADFSVPTSVAASFLPPNLHSSSLPRHHQQQSFSHSEQESSTTPAPSGKFVTSPMVGTFYAAAAPGQPPFVKAGDRVEESTVVCVVEAMKVMNEVKAGVSGIIGEILIDNAQPVEFGTKIFSIV